MTVFLAAARIFGSETMAVSAGNSVDGCDSKKSCVSPIFSCSAGYGVGDELADVWGAEHCKMTSLGAGELV
jgi:hypothetical protein